VAETIVLEWLIKPEFTGIYCAFIEAVFAAMLIKCVCEKNRIIRSLSEGEAAVGERFAEGGWISRTAHFAVNLGPISQAIGNIPLLKDKWHEFVNSLFVPEGGGKDCAYGSLPAESFFSEEGFLHRHYSERLFSAVPNYLTGIGILGTFLALAAGIVLADFSDVIVEGQIKDQKVMDALETLTNAAELAFITSLAGLSLSIVFSVAEKRVFGMALARLSSFNALLDSSIVLFSAEVLAKMQLDLLHGLKDSPAGGGRPGLAVRTELEGSVVPFVAGFEASMEGLLAKNVERAVKPELDRIAGLLEDIHHNRSLEVSRAVKIMVDAFLESLQGSAHEAIESVAGNLRKVAEECNPITENLREVNRIIEGNIGSGEAMAREVQKAASELSAVAASLSESAGAAERAVQAASVAAGDAAERYGEIAEGLDRTVTRTLDGQTAAVALLNEELERVRAEVSTGMDGIGRSVEGLFAGVDARIAETHGESVKAMEAAAEAAAAEIGKAGASLEGAILARSAELFEGVEKRIDVLGDGLAAEIARLPVEAERFWEGLRGKLDEMSDRLDGTLAEAGKGQRELHLAMLGQIDECGKELGQALSGIADAHEGVYSQVLAKLEIYNTRFAELLAVASGGSERMFRELDDTVRRLYADLAAMYDKTTKGFATAATAVNDQTLSFIADQRVVLEKHNDSVERIWRGQEMCAKALDAAADRMLHDFNDHISYLAESYVQHDEMYSRHLGKANEFLDRLESLWKSYGSKFGDIDDALSRTLERLHKSYEANIKDAERFLAELDKGFEEAVAALRETAREMSQAIKQMGGQRDGQLSK
jgi:ABC-type transporter Mla subunit MlaD